MCKLKDAILTEIENSNTSAFWIDEPWPTSLSRDERGDSALFGAVLEWKEYSSDDNFKLD